MMCRGGTANDYLHLPGAFAKGDLSLGGELGAGRRNVEPWSVLGISRCGAQRS